MTRQTLRRLDRLALAVLILGLVLLFQPWWHGGLRWGFFVTIAGTVAFVVTSRLTGGAPP
jgi:hypothetical protein